MKTKAALSIAMASVLFAPAARAEPPATASSDVGASASTGADTGADTAAEPERASDRGAFVAGGKFGAIATLSGFGPNITGALEIGYILPFLKRSFGVLVDVSYAAPVLSGSEQDPRVSGGKYDWSLVQKQLTIAPTVVFRYTRLGRIVPFIGVGPRIVLMEGVTDGAVGETKILETKERSTAVGVGVPLGAEYLIGPGAAMAEVLFQHNGIAHRATGEGSLNSFTIWLGYRFML